MSRSLVPASARMLTLRRVWLVSGQLALSFLLNDVRASTSEQKWAHKKKSVGAGHCCSCYRDVCSVCPLGLGLLPYRDSWFSFCSLFHAPLLSSTSFVSDPPSLSSRLSSSRPPIQCCSLSRSSVAIEIHRNPEPETSRVLTLSQLCRVQRSTRRVPLALIPRFRWTTRLQGVQGCTRTRSRSASSASSSGRSRGARRNSTRPSDGL